MERLNFLQRAGTKRGRVTAKWSLLAITLGLAFASAAFVQPVWRRPSEPKPHFIRTPPPSATPAASQGRVWLVEGNDRFELYSNGLQILNQFLATTRPRAYLALPRSGIREGPARLRLDPAGIVFHTTESHMAPFEEKQNGTLRRAGEGLLEFVRRNRSYHFVVDRFGRVFRVVRESDYANHAGHSIWADQNWVYLNLNQSFFGVAFEAKTNAAQPVNAAQVHAARILIEMLRARYKIAPENCVTHAQVSVNPSNHRAGYHTDWAASLPFRELGLTDNYQRPLPSVYLFGFKADSLLAEVDGAGLGPALEKSEDMVQQQAAARRLPLERYRSILQRSYKDAIASTGRN